MKAAFLVLLVVGFAVGLPAQTSPVTPATSKVPAKAQIKRASFGNGMQAKLSGNTLVVTDAGGHQSSYKRTAGTPSADPSQKLTNHCFKLKHWLDTHGNSSTWRQLCLDYFDTCM